MPQKKIQFDILTLFPEFFESPLSTSLISKALKKGVIGINFHDIRQYGVGKRREVDDRPFGGGPGMILKPDVLERSLQSVISATPKHSEGYKPYIVLLDPAGKVYNQEKAQKLSKKKWLVFICGHYEGVDERFKDLFVDEEISIGDYILGGGETAALVLIDSISRLIPGFLGEKQSLVNESFSSAKVNQKKVKLLDYPVYTRPEEFAGKKVPGILLSGDHAKINKWRLDEQIEKTKRKRPDLLKAKT